MAALPLILAAVVSMGPQAKFATEDAVKCAAVYAVTLDAMRHASNVPTEVRKQMRDGLAMWEYELSASAPNATAEALQTAADSAVEAVYANLPDGSGAEAAAARGEYLRAASAACAEGMAAAYQGAEHPVVPYLAAADAEAGLADMAAPVIVEPVSMKEEDSDDAPRGLR